MDINDITPEDKAELGLCKLFKERELLKKLYECHDEMAELLDGGKEDIHYGLMEILIKRLEDHLSGETTII